MSTNTNSNTVPGSKVHFRPAGVQSLVPQLNLSDALAAIDWYKQALGAELVEEPVMDQAKKKVMHAELKIYDSIFFANSIFEGAMSVPASHSSFFLYVPDVDQAYQRAIKAGATSIWEVQDKFWGDRCGGLTDPYGNCWTIATHIKDVSREEINNVNIKM